MTEMKRVSIPIPETLDQRILELRKRDEFVRCSYAEIVRRLLERGLDLNEQEAG